MNWTARWRTGISPDGHARLDIAIGGGLISHEICSPRITGVATGRVILDLIDQGSWDGSVRWLDNGDFAITIRNYIAGGPVLLPVHVYRAAGTFVIGEPPGRQEPLSDLPRRLPEALLQKPPCVDPPKLHFVSPYPARVEASMTPLRLTIAWAMLLLTAALPAQNPLTPQSDPYSGVFQNEQMKLELNQASGEYGGVIQFQAQTLPVKGRIHDGALPGSFESNGQSFSFRATRKDGKLTFQTDGATYVLEIATAPQSARSRNVAAGSLVGSWQSDRGILRINADGTANIGMQSHRYTVASNVITFTGGAEPIRIPFDLAGDTWTWNFPDAKLTLTRVNTAAASSPAGSKLTGAWQGPNGTLQIDPGGTLVFNGDSYRFTQSGNYLTITGQGQTFLIAVQQTGDSMTWQISGKTWTFTRGAAGTQVATTTGGGVLPELVGTWCQMAYLNNSAGTYGRSTCFTLRPNGTYQYGGESSAGGQNHGEFFKDRRSRLPFGKTESPEE